MRISQNLLQDIVGELITLEKLPEQGWTSEVSRIVTKNGTYLIKSAFKEKYRDWLRAEAKVLMSLADGREIPVPAYKGFIEEDETSHLIMSFEKGITLTAALREAMHLSDKERLVRSFGCFIQKLHEQEPVSNREGDWLDTQLNKAQLYAEKGQSEGSLELLEQLKSCNPQVVKQTMIHGDYTTDNVLVIDGEVQMFIDVAGMTVGDPRYDEALAIRKFRHHPELLAAFYKGYTRYRVSQEEIQYFEGLYEFF
ncbi:phosphotransferase [Mesobacillus subterraneus]|uniref:phosphotransferase n=1 Tax=Mesobacillus subterraneus TaxID=285983 RepID=UPI00203F70F6|nr:phosphotransferase [Mesobacillus subterraneus]MCM3666119.1 phosphotransferase [Mesobacillus subterraneus]